MTRRSEELLAVEAELRRLEDQERALATLVRLEAEEPVLEPVRVRPMFLMALADLPRARKSKPRTPSEVCGCGCGMQQHVAARRRAGGTR